MCFFCSFIIISSEIMRKLNSTPCQNKQHWAHRCCCWRCLCNLTQQLDISANYWHALVISIPFRFNSIHLWSEKQILSNQSIDAKEFQLPQILCTTHNDRQFKVCRLQMPIFQHFHRYWKTGDLCGIKLAQIWFQMKFHSSLTIYNNQLSHTCVCPKWIDYEDISIQSDYLK